MIIQYFWTIFQTQTPLHIVIGNLAIYSLGRKLRYTIRSNPPDLIASQQQKELNMSKDDEDEDIEYLTPEENVAKSEKFHDRNLFPSGLVLSHPFLSLYLKA